MMTNPLIQLPEQTIAEQVVTYIASHVVETGWEFTFAHMNTKQGRLHLSETNKIPILISWEDIIKEAASGDLDCLLDTITSHTEEIEIAGRKSVLSENVQDWLNQARAEYSPTGDISLLLCSRVVFRGEQPLLRKDTKVKHIPMMDFRCEPSARNLKLIVKAMRKLGQQDGVVLESGRSYHYYGFNLLDEIEWRDFMYRSLLLTPFVDARYIGHRLLAGTARLRITASCGKPTVPHKVANLRDV